MDYFKSVEPVPFAADVPQFPAPRPASELHFPNPNSRELLEREEHIHEHLPPLNPEWDGMLSLLLVFHITQIGIKFNLKPVCLITEGPSTVSFGSSGVSDLMFQKSKS